MLSSMPGKGLGMAAKRIGEAAARPAKVNPKMEFLKKKVAPLKKRQGDMPAKSDGMKKMLPSKDERPSFMKPGYKPGSIKRGYTKYA